MFIKGTAAITTTYSKNNSINDRATLNCRFLDSQTSLYLFQYLSLIRPTLLLLASIKSSNQTQINNLNSYLFVHPSGERFNSNNIKMKYCEIFKKFMHVYIDFSTNRQLMIYFAKVNNIRLWLGSKEGNTADEVNEDGGFDIQANHSAKTANINYGRGRADPFINIVGIDDYTRGLEFSTKWQELLLVKTSTIPNILHSNTVHNSIETISSSNVDNSTGTTPNIPTQSIVNIYSYNYFSNSQYIPKKRKLNEIFADNNESQLSIFDVHNQTEEKQNSRIKNHLQLHGFEDWRSAEQLTLLKK
ncbi:ATP-dependent DNA helicase sgs1, partial [Clydaea vesicula]